MLIEAGGNKISCREEQIQSAIFIFEVDKLITRQGDVNLY
jgi:hypothetical protein